MDTPAAARALGVKESEVAQVEDSPAGPVITTKGGTRYVIVPESRPDADGKTGLMFLVAPVPGYSGLFPVYAQPKEAAEEEAEEAPAERAGEVTPAPRKATRARGSAKR